MVAGLQLDERRLDPSFQRQFSGHYFRIDFSDRSWRSRSLWDRELLKPNGIGMQAELGDGPQGQLLLIYRADYRRYGENLSISVAQDYQPILQSFRRMQWVGLGLRRCAAADPCCPALHRSPSPAPTGTGASADRATAAGST